MSAAVSPRIVPAGIALTAATLAGAVDTTRPVATFLALLGAVTLIGYTLKLAAAAGLPVPAPKLPSITASLLDVARAGATYATRRPVKRHRPRAARVNVLTYNTHVGRALPGLRWLLTKPGLRRTHIVCLQEVQTRRAKLAARLLLPPGMWITAGPPLNSPAGTIVYARRSRFRKEANYHHKITPGPAQGALPGRYLDGGVFRDKVTGRLVDVTSVHTWALGKGLAQADDHAAGKHVAQVAAVANHHTGQLLERPAAQVSTLVVFDDPDLLHVAAGDWNETIGTRHHASGAAGRPPARLTMARAGMRPTSDLTRNGDRVAGLDEVFVAPRPWLTVVDRREVHPPAHLPGVEPEHAGVWVSLHVEPLKA